MPSGVASGRSRCCEMAEIFDACFPQNKGSCTNGTRTGSLLAPTLADVRRGKSKNNKNQCEMDPRKSRGRLFTPAVSLTSPPPPLFFLIRLYLSPFRRINARSSSNPEPPISSFLSKPRHPPPAGNQKPPSMQNPSFFSPQCLALAPLCMAIQNKSTATPTLRPLSALHGALHSTLLMLFRSWLSAERARVALHGFVRKKKKKKKTFPCGGRGVINMCAGSGKWGPT